MEIHLCGTDHACLAHGIDCCYPGLDSWMSRRALRLVLWLAGLVVALLVVTVIALLVQTSNNNDAITRANAALASTRREVVRDHDAAFDECLRVQYRRSLGNYDIAVMRKAIIDIVTVQMQASVLRNLSRADRRARVNEAKTLKRYAHGILFEPATDCRAAIDQDGAYRPPQAYPFTDRLAAAMLAAGPPKYPYP